MTEAFRILFPGPYTTIQDRGRFHYQDRGVPVSGSLDTFASVVANWLVGNSSDCAVLEMTYRGVHLEITCEAYLAIAGADMGAKLNGHPFPAWTSVYVKPGDTIRMGVAKSGCRSYLAITGGIDVPLVMGSRSTYVGGKLGGLEGRTLRMNDLLHRGQGSLLSSPRSFPWPPEYAREIPLRALPGPQLQYFQGIRDMFFSANFTVTSQADRMGYRLAGPEIARDPGAPKSIISEPITPGNIQILPSGQAVILLVEQTLGGYTKIATVLSSDIMKVAQAKPGDIIRFVPVTLTEAHKAYREWIQYMARTKSFLDGLH